MEAAGYFREALKNEPGNARVSANLEEALGKLDGGTK